MSYQGHTYFWIVQEYCCIDVIDPNKNNNSIKWTINPYENDEILKLDYEITNDYFIQLSEIRFKLLAFVPLVSGSAIGLLTLNNEGQSVDSEGALLLGFFGLFVTLGVVFYDLRNSQFYDIAVCRAKNLEKLLKMPLGGLFNERPGHTKGPTILGLFTVWHDRGLALIYGTTLAGWSYLITYSFLQMINHSSLLGSVLVALIVLYISVIIFKKIEKRSRRHGDE